MHACMLRGQILFVYFICMHIHRYRIQQGSFDDFLIDNRTGLITIGKKLDYDRRNTYQIEIVASDLGMLNFEYLNFPKRKQHLFYHTGTPSLSGTATLIVNINNSNDKDPYFTPATQRADVIFYFFVLSHVF